MCKNWILNCLEISKKIDSLSIHSVGVHSECIWLDVHYFVVYFVVVSFEMCWLFRSFEMQIVKNSYSEFYKNNNNFSSKNKHEIEQNCNALSALNISLTIRKSGAYFTAAHVVNIYNYSTSIHISTRHKWNRQCYIVNGCLIILKIITFQREHFGFTFLFTHWK